MIPKRKSNVIESERFWICKKIEGIRQHLYSDLNSLIALVEGYSKSMMSADMELLTSLSLGLPSPLL